MLSLVRTIAARVTVAAVAGALLLGALPASAAVTLDELTDMATRAWNGEPELLAEVYAPDAVHTATFQDTTTVYEGLDAIEPIAAVGSVEVIGPRIEIPAPDGEYRWASFVSLAGGSTCLWQAVDGLIKRQDCLVPKASNRSRRPADVTGQEPSPELMELVTRLEDAWGSGTSLEQLASVYAPGAVHTARTPGSDHTYTYEGPAEILAVAGLPGAPQRIGPIVEFEAPDGELAWASVVDVSGGTVCRFEAVDGLVTRHDCLLPDGS